MSLQSYPLDPQREIIIGINQPMNPRMKKLQNAPVIAGLSKTKNVKVFTVLSL